MHKNEDNVKAALLKPKNERNRVFQCFKRVGIHKVNMKLSAATEPEYLRERKARKCEKIVMCTSCKGFFASSYLARHMSTCGKDSCTTKLCVPVKLIADTAQDGLKENFKTDILNVLRNDEIGIIAKSDPTIMMIGSRLFEKVRRRMDKKSEVQSSVRTDMRRLSHLYNHFRKFEPKSVHGNAADLFIRCNFSSLKSAIEVYTDSDEDTQKSGLKAALYYLIAGSAKKCIGQFLAQDKDDSAKAISDFLMLLQLRKDELFGDATYDLNQRRNVKSKKPAQLPIEGDIKMIRCHVIDIMRKYQADVFHMWDIHSFVELRDCACTRLTLFNGRRGGEPARLLLREWVEADEGAWLDEQRMDDMLDEADMNEKIKITYQSGKGVNHLVPVMIPHDTVYAMKILSNVEVRKNAGILESNIYIFASTQGSAKHCSGWHSLDNICEKLPIIERSRVTGTTNRHRLSTLIAGLDLTEIEKDLAYKHFGHSKEMNERVYQAPAAHMQLASTGKHLLAIDTGKYYTKFIIFVLLSVLAYRFKNM